MIGATAYLVVRLTFVLCHEGTIKVVSQVRPVGKFGALYGTTALIVYVIPVSNTIRSVASYCYQNELEGGIRPTGMHQDVVLTCGGPGCEDARVFIWAAGKRFVSKVETLYGVCCCQFHRD